MRIAINAGGLGTGMAVAEYQLNMAGFVSGVDDVISSFKTVKKKINELSGGLSNLQDAADNIDARIRQEEEKKKSAETVALKANDFLDLAIRVDKQVAGAVRKNRDEFYEKYSWLKPVVEVEEEKNWLQKGWDWVCGAAGTVVEGAKKVWDWTKDTAQKAWDWAVDFYHEHWYDIVNWGVTILCAVGSIVAIALIPVTGGASILLVAGVSALSGAIVAATRSITTQQRDKGTVDWGEVGKEAFTAAVVGAVTGAIGAGIGGAITSSLSNTGLGTSLLNSSSTLVRMTTGAVIGSASEVASGVVTRGAAEATTSLLEDGTVDFGDVWDAATDPQQIALDAAIGGASGGLSAAKKPTNAVGEMQNGTVDNTSGANNSTQTIYTKEELDSLGQKAVKGAWENEVELVKQGKGTRDWSVSQQAELLEYGKVSGFEGQHMKSKAAFPEYAGDPSNIQFLTYEEHFYGAHAEKFTNMTNGRFDPSTGKMIPFADGERPTMPVIELTDKYDASQFKLLEELGRSFGFGRHADIQASRARIFSKT